MIIHMMIKQSISNALFTGLFFCLSVTQANDLTFSSTETQVSVIELYTSEGCSSCPPADKWLNKLQQSDLLWKKVVPLAFHVDYWDYLGWQDKFADKRFAQRQRHYQRMNYVSAVYTPGIMKNGREWRGWRWWQDPETDGKNKPGVLSALLNEKFLSVTFNALLKNSPSYLLNVALLGVDIKSDVKDGENSGELFEHDFVVLDFQQHKKNQPNNKNSWVLSNPLLSTNHKINAIAIWITRENDQTPIQATGSWVNQ